MKFLIVTIFYISLEGWGPPTLNLIAGPFDSLADCEAALSIGLDQTGFLQKNSEGKLVRIDAQGNINRWTLCSPYNPSW